MPHTHLQKHAHPRMHTRHPPPGMLQLVPVVNPPSEHLASALKRSARVPPSAAIKNEAEKERNRAARQLDTLMKELSVPLTKYLAGFPKLGSLHPFEAALLDLTVGKGTYTAVIAKVGVFKGSPMCGAYPSRLAHDYSHRVQYQHTIHMCQPQVDALRKAVQEVGKAYANRAAKAGSKRDAAAAAEEGVEMMQKVGGWVALMLLCHHLMLDGFKHRYR